MSKIITVKDYQKLGLLTLAEKQGGEIEALKLIDARYKKGELTKKQAHDLRIAIKESYRLNITEIGNEYINELNSKVKESIAFYR